LTPCPHSRYDCAFDAGHADGKAGLVNAGELSSFGGWGRQK